MINSKWEKLSPERIAKINRIRELAKKIKASGKINDVPYAGK